MPHIYDHTAIVFMHRLYQGPFLLTQTLFLLRPLCIPPLLSAARYIAFRSSNPLLIGLMKTTYHSAMVDIHCNENYT